MAKHRRKRAGRPRKTGERKPSGQLRWKPPGPNETVVERRKALLDDDKGLHRADNPLDLAFARGWLTERHHRAGESFARLRRNAGLDAPGLSYAGLPEVDTGSRRDVRTWNQLSDEEIADVWTRVIERGVTTVDNSSEKSMDSWVSVCAILSRDELREVELVCVNQSWPQWVLQRCAGKFETSWERKRDILMAGLEVVAKSFGGKPEGPEPAGILSFGQMNAKPAGRVMEETEIHVDQDGAFVREVVRRRRVG